MVINGLEVTIAQMKQKVTTKQVKQNTECNGEQTGRANKKAESQKCLTMPQESNYLAPSICPSISPWGWSESKTTETQNF